MANWDYMIDKNNIKEHFYKQFVKECILHHITLSKVGGYDELIGFSVHFGNEDLSFRYVDGFTVCYVSFDKRKRTWHIDYLDKKIPFSKNLMLETLNEIIDHPLDNAITCVVKNKRVVEVDGMKLK